MSDVDKAPDRLPSRNGPEPAPPESAWAGCGPERALGMLVGQACVRECVQARLKAEHDACQYAIDALRLHRLLYWLLEDYCAVARDAGCDPESYVLTREVRAALARPKQRGVPEEVAALDAEVHQAAEFNSNLLTIILDQYDRAECAERIAEAARPIADWLWSVRLAGGQVGNLDMTLVDRLHDALEAGR